MRLKWFTSQLERKLEIALEIELEDLQWRSPSVEEAACWLYLASSDYGDLRVAAVDA